MNPVQNIPTFLGYVLMKTKFFIYLFAGHDIIFVIGSERKLKFWTPPSERGK